MPYTLTPRTMNFLLAVDQADRGLNPLDVPSHHKGVRASALRTGLAQKDSAGQFHLTERGQQAMLTGYTDGPPPERKPKTAVPEKTAAACEPCGERCAYRRALDLVAGKFPEVADLVAALQALDARRA